MGLSFTVLGSSGTYATAGNACTGYFVECGGTNVWVDCGPGTLANLQRHIALPALDALVISHSHPDHWLELPVVRNALKYAFGRQGFPVYGTAETRTFLEAVVDDFRPTFDWHVIADGDEASIGAARFTFSRTDHPVETLAMRVEEAGTGRSFAYSADTAAGWSFERFGRPLDLALCEATLRADQEGMAPHMSARQAGASAAAAGAGRLVITHLWPGSDPEQLRAEAAAAYGGPVEIATIHTRFEV